MKTCSSALSLSLETSPKNTSTAAPHWDIFVSRAPSLLIASSSSMVLKACASLFLSLQLRMLVLFLNCVTVPTHCLEILTWSLLAPLLPINNRLWGMESHFWMWGCYFSGSLFKDILIQSTHTKHTSLYLFSPTLHSKTQTLIDGLREMQKRK